MSWLNLEGKSVIVTGGASGIGKAIVEACRRRTGRSMRYEPAAARI